MSSRRRAFPVAQPPPQSTTPTVYEERDQTPIPIPPPKPVPKSSQILTPFPHCPPEMQDRWKKYKERSRAPEMKFKKKKGTLTLEDPVEEGSPEKNSKCFSFKQIQNELHNCHATSQNSFRKQEFFEQFVQDGEIQKTIRTCPWQNNKLLTSQQQIHCGYLSETSQAYREKKYVPNLNYVKVSYDKKTDSYASTYTPAYLKIYNLFKQKTDNLDACHLRLKRHPETWKGQKKQFLQKILQQQSLRIAELQQQISIIVTQLKQLNKKCQDEKIKFRLAHKEKHGYFARHNWGLFLNRYLPLEMLGCGGFGEVYKCYDFWGHQDIAMKINFIKKVVMSPKDEEAMERRVRHIKREVSIHRQLKHERVATYYDTYKLEEPTQRVIFSTMEYCRGRDLSEYIRIGYKFALQVILEIIHQILEVLDYLRDLRIIHYDLKPQNIIYNFGGIKIIDFGLSKVMEEGEEEIELTSVGAGSPAYLPPETFDSIRRERRGDGRDYRVRCFDDLRVSTSVDMWSVGVILYELLYGVRPFGKGVEAGELFFSGVMRGQLEVEFLRREGEEVGEEVKEFVLECFRQKAERITPRQGMEHRCFESVRGNMLRGKKRISKGVLNRQGKSKLKEGRKTRGKSPKSISNEKKEKEKEVSASPKKLKRSKTVNKFRTDKNSELDGAD